MKIRIKLIASHGALALSIAVICCLMLATLETTDRNRRFLEDSYELLRQMDELDSNTNRMSEQIAELFTVGLSGRGEVTEAYQNLTASLATLRMRLHKDLANGQNEGRQQRERAMLRWIERMDAHVGELIQVADQLEEMLRKGDLEAARSLYSSRVEDGLDSDIARLMDEATAADEEQVLAAIDRWDRQTEFLRFLAITAVVIGAALAIGNALAMDKAVSRPIAELARAVDDLAENRIRPSLPAQRSDELGQLATRFDQMAERLVAQQSALVAARDALTAQVAERTESLFRRTRELEEANIRLTQLNATRMQFFADVSHELRTPLTVIRGQAEVVLRQADAAAADFARVMRQIVRRAERMARLVDDLLFLARSEAGVIGFTFRSVTIQEIVAETVFDVGPLRKSRNVTIALHQPPEPLWVYADAQRIAQVLLILLDNALSHAPDHTMVSLDVERNHNEVRVAVSDAGSGFSDIDRDRVFDRFYRGKDRASRRGVGLGLPIARWITEQHKGRIWIDKQAAARVIVALPLENK